MIVQWFCMRCRLLRRVVFQLHLVRFDILHQASKSGHPGGHFFARGFADCSLTATCFRNRIVNFETAFDQSCSDSVKSFLARLQAGPVHKLYVLSFCTL